MRKTMFVCLILLLQSFCFSQQRLSLQEAINTALKNNFNIQIAKNTVDIARINNNIGIAGGLPTVSATASDQESVVNINQKINSAAGERNISRNGATSNNISTNIAGSMLLYNGYRIISTKKKLELLQAQSEQGLIAQVQNTIAAVMTKYYDVVRQQSYMKTLLQSIEVSKKQLEIIDVKRKIGFANNADLFQAQIDLNTRQQDLQSQQIILEQGKADLLNLLSIQADSAISITDTIVADGNIKLEEVLTGMEKNPDIISASQQVTINQLIEKETSAQRYPALRLNSGVNYGRNQSDGGQLLLNQSYGPYLGLNVSIPIYNGSIFKRQEQTAAINTQNARLQKQSLVLNYKTNLTKTYQSYIHNIDLIKTQQATNELSAQLVQLALQRFQLAQATIIEVREAQKSFEDAGFRLVNLSYAAKAAEIELKRIAGKLGLQQ